MPEGSDRLEDLLSSFRRHVPAAAKTPRTIELYSQGVRYFSRWLTDRGREPGASRWNHPR